MYLSMPPSWLEVLFSSMQFYYMLLSIRQESLFLCPLMPTNLQNIDRTPSMCQSVCQMVERKREMRNGGDDCRN